MLIDSHAHLEMRDFDPDREEVVRRAVESGVTAMVTVGTNLRDCRKAAAIAAKFPEVYAAIGIHPHDVKGIHDEMYREIRKLAAEPRWSPTWRSAPISSEPLPPGGPDPALRRAARPGGGTGSAGDHP
jgi:Tat protein secretion system quality control protein TatD with DNase activity